MLVRKCLSSANPSETQVFSASQWVEHAYRPCIQTCWRTKCTLFSQTGWPQRGDETQAGCGRKPAQLPHPTRSVTCAPRRSSNVSSANKMADAVNVVFPRKLVKEFVTLYQNLPCLWDKHCISYKMKHKRHEAITKLTQLVQEYDPSATRVHVLRKIESLRACVRREHKRVQHSKKIAENEADIYTPHLWYYDLFTFMFQTDAMNEDYDKKKGNVSSPQPATEVSKLAHGRQIYLPVCYNHERACAVTSCLR